MSEKYNKEELLKKISHWRDMCGLYAEDHDYDCDNCKEAFFATPCKQAYRQIKEMIKKPEMLPQKRGLTVDEIISKYPESVRILLVELVQKIENLQKKSEITELWIKKMAWDIWNKNFDARVETYSLGRLEEFIKKKLKEAGVEVVEK